MKKEIQFESRSCSAGERPAFEKNDCTVRAISNAFDVPYETAHSFLANNGRQNKHGIPFVATIGRKARVIFGRRISYHKRPKKTIGTFAKKHPTGTYILLVYRHATVLKNGVIIDLRQPSSGRPIKEYYYISPAKQPQCK